jgi:hypothetical protein
VHSRGVKLRNVPFSWVVNSVSSCFDPLFRCSWAPPELLHIFSLLLSIQLL